ncbi:hypothetical protein BO70DRAFT_259273, partial [Aspergillus heteromorphus CBS 117.55]
LSSTNTNTTTATTGSSNTTLIPIFDVETTGTPTPTTFSGYAGSILSVNADATTIIVSCTVAACSIATPYTLIQGPSTFSMSQAVSSESLGVEVWMTITEECHITASTSAVCSNLARMKVSAYGEEQTTKTAYVVTATGTQIYADVLVVTGGIEKLNSPQATESAGAAA